MKKLITMFLAVMFGLSVTAFASSVTYPREKLKDTTTSQGNMTTNQRSDGGGAKVAKVKKNAKKNVKPIVVQDAPVTAPAK
jgi:hypothetical protein